MTRPLHEDARRQRYGQNWILAQRSSKLAVHMLGLGWITITVRQAKLFPAVVTHLQLRINSSWLIQFKWLLPRCNRFTKKHAYCFVHDSKFHHELCSCLHSRHRRALSLFLTALRSSGMKQIRGILMDLALPGKGNCASYAAPVGPQSAHSCLTHDPLRWEAQVVHLQPRVRGWKIVFRNSRH